MTLDLDAIKARAEAATPGPWKCLGMGDVVTPTFVIQTTDRNPADSRFIAHARTDVPALVAEVERLRRVERAARKVHARGGRYPTHLGGCIGVLSQPECPCGIGDLGFAVLALDQEADAPREVVR